MKRRLYELLEGHDRGDPATRHVTTFLVWLITLNVAAAVLETVEQINAAAPRAFHAFEAFSVAVFTIEYLLRLWSCTEDPRYAGPIAGRLRWMLTPMAIVDLVAFAPFYVPMLHVDLRFVRALRLARLVRVAKLTRYSTTIPLMGRVLRRKRNELVVVLLTLLLVLLTASSLMYVVERDVQPEKFSSIPAAMYWGAATLTTVGYGDIYPISPLGRLLASLIAVIGIGMFALPAGILGAGFIEEMTRPDRPREVCPHCGKELPRRAG